MVKSQKKTRRLRSSSRSKKQTSSVLTIPQLRKSFDHMDKVVERLRKVAKHSFSDAVVAYREEWRKVFKRDLSPADAAAYLKFRYAMKGSRAVTRRTKTRGGSMALAGAPLDYQTRGGVDGVYGNFPTYQTSGLDRYYGSAMTASCGKEAQAGGSWSDGLFRPLMPGSPVNMAYDTMMSGKGIEPVSTSDPVGPAPLRSMPISYIPPANVQAHIRHVPR
jgi:hypothetical protein